MALCNVTGCAAQAIQLRYIRSLCKRAVFTPRGIQEEGYLKERGPSRQACCCSLFGAACNQHVDQHTHCIQHHCVQRSEDAPLPISIVCSKLQCFAIVCASHQLFDFA